MEISTILSHIDSGHMALPEFQRGYVWSRDQVRGFFDSLYRRHPVGSLLVWATESKTAVHRGDGTLAAGIVKLLLDGQQRITSLYGVVRGHPPKFFEGNHWAFTGLYFNLETEQFNFYMPTIMKDDPLWISVTELMQKGNDGVGFFIQRLTAKPEYLDKTGVYFGRLSKLLGIKDIKFNIEDVTGDDKTIDIVVDIFNKVNSGGTKLSKGDLALAKICAEWPDARDTMKAKLKVWKDANYNFNLDWLLRSVNTILTGEAKFLYLHDKTSEEISHALKKATKHIDTCLNMIAGRLGLDHDQVLFGRFGIPVMVRYLDNLNGGLNEKNRDKLLFWFVQSGMWGRFSGSTESYIDKDLSALESSDNGLNPLLEQLRLWHGGLRVESGHFKGWSLGARFYPVLYMLTRMGEACDWGTGLPLKANLLGSMSKLEVHHIFPKSKLYKAGYNRAEVNAVANYCFLTKETNLNISDRFPEEYFEEIERAHPGALASQWIPMDRNLWKIENFLDFLEERQKLLAEETNKRMLELLHGENFWLEGKVREVEEKVIPGGISSEEEERVLEDLRKWMEDKGLSSGILSFDFSDQESGEQLAVFDLAWPQGIQEELSEPAAVLLNEPAETISIANKGGFRCFTSVKEFKNYVNTEIVREPIFDFFEQV
jgi:hypothetical protein